MCFTDENHFLFLVSFNFRAASPICPDADEQTSKRIQDRASKLNRKFAREYRLLMELLIFCRLTLSLCIIRLDVTVQRQNKNILDYASFPAAGVRDNFASFTTKTISFATIEANLVNQMCALKHHDMTIIWSN
jgi:hypothetical protein